MTRDSLILIATALALAPACSSSNSKSCYSPTANVASVFDPGAVGCGCNPALDQPVCVRSETVGYVGLLCGEGRWRAVYDGPCMVQKDAGSPPDGVPSSLDGALDRSDEADARDVPIEGANDGGSCIILSDIPGAEIRCATSPSLDLTLEVLSGPCDTNYGRINFSYWTTGYSCPRFGDKVVCDVRVTSSLGSQIVPVTFQAVWLDSKMLHWVPTQQPVLVDFSSVDGGAAEVPEP